MQRSPTISVLNVGVYMFFIYKICYNIFLWCPLVVIKDFGPTCIVYRSITLCIGYYKFGIAYQLHNFQVLSMTSIMKWQFQAISAEISMLFFNKVFHNFWCTVFTRNVHRCFSIPILIIFIAVTD